MGEPTGIAWVGAADEHPYLNAALATAAPANAQEDLFERTARSVLRGLLVNDS